MQPLFPRNAAQRKFAWVIRATVLLRIAALFVLLALALTWFGLR